MGSRDVRVGLQIVNDTAATRRSVRDVDRLTDALEDQENATQKTARAYSDMEEAAERAARANRDAAEANVRLAKEQSEYIGDAASRTSQLSGALSGLGVLGGTRLQIATDIFDAAEAAQVLKATFPAMIEQLIAARSQILLFAGIGGAIAVGTLALNAYNKAKEDERQRIEATRTAIHDYINAQVELETFLINATQDEIEVRKKARETDIAGIEAALAPTEEVYKKAREVIEAQLRIMFGAILAQGKITEEEFQKNVDAATASALGIDEFTMQMQEFRKEIDRLDEALLPTGDSLSQLVDGPLFELGSAGRRATNELGNAVDQLNQTSNVLNGLSGIIGGVFDKASDAASGVIDFTPTVDRKPIQVLTDQAIDIIWDFEQQRIALAEDTGTKIADVEQQAADKRLDIIARSEEKIADLQAKFRRDLVDLESDTVSARAEAITDTNETLAEIEQDFNDDRSDALAEFQKQERRRLEDHQDDMRDAASRLDAQALLQSKRQFAKDSKRAAEDFKDQQDERDKQFKDRFEQEKKALDKELRQIEDNYRQRENDLRTTLNRQIIEERNAANQRLYELQLATHQQAQAIYTAEQQKLNAINQSQTNQLNALYGFQTTEEQARQQHYDDMLADLNTFFLQAQVNALAANSTPYTGPNTPGAVGQVTLPIVGPARSPFMSPFTPAMMGGGSVSAGNPAITNVTNNNSFNVPDMLTPGQAKNVRRLIMQEFQRLA